MNRYIALLRGINVGGQKKIKMVSLKDVFEKLGFTSIITYIQSGNVVFQSTSKNTENLGEIIKKEIAKQFGYDVPVLVIERSNLQSIYNQNPFLNRVENEEIAHKKMYYTLLYKEPDPQDVEQILLSVQEGEEFVVVQKCVYFYVSNGYGTTKLNNNFFEKKLKCSATTRNFRTISKLLALSDL